ncbi:MAG TPA: hypothetical protein VIF62_19195, partial [Labilithrix sp.]
MRGRLCALLLLVAMLLVGGGARAASDPSLRWYTIRTPHFYVTYHSGLDEVGQHVASVAESIYGNMVEHVGSTPSEPTEIILSDFSEVANGSAGALPYNAVRLIVTAPDDMSPLGDVDDWYLELVTHEFTHVVHTDNIHGIPAIVNAVLGKTLAPNQVQPRWILEGFAVHEESARTSGGRLRDSMWDMFMRTDVLDDNVASIDQVSNTVRRWPQGNLFYLYGSYFTKWIADTYGEDALRRAARDYGGQLIPWGFNRSIRRATGETYVEMYPKWIASMRARYGAQAALVRGRGIREGRRLTFDGQDTRYVRWIPKGAWPEHQGGLLYVRQDEQNRNGLVALDVTRDARGAVTSADWKHAELVARTSGLAYPGFTPDGGLVFSSSNFYKNVFVYSELERMAPGAKSKYGPDDGNRTVHTDTGVRADAPSVAPDGRRVVFTENHSGTRAICLGEHEKDAVTNIRPLVAMERFEQAFTPRWSPDGTRVAFSIWKRGGKRDIRLVDLRDGSYRDLTDDRAVDGGPSFSPDGRFLFFHSDRTGITNIYAIDLVTNRVYQITNVLTGAYHPDVSPDGKTLAYLGYTKVGFDIFAMPLDPRDWIEAPAYEDDRPNPPTVPERRWDVQSYSPWRTLLPRRTSVQITQGAFGQAAILSATSSDVTGIHTVSASTTVEFEHPEIQGALGYTYARLPFDFGVSVFRSIAPRTGIAIGDYKPTVIQETAGFASTVAYTIPRAFDTSSFVLTHSISRVAVDLPLPADKLDPYDTPNIPATGFASNVHLGYSFTNAENYLFGVGPEGGVSFNVAVDFTHPDLGSDFEG